MKKNSPETLSVPKELVKEIEWVLRQNPTAFKYKKLNEESIYFISDSLLQRMSSSIKQIEEAGDLEAFYPLHSDILRAVCHNYKAHLEFMIASEIIECDGHWIVGEKSLGYRFTEKYLSEIQQVPVAGWCLKRALRRRNLKLIAERKAENRGYNYLTKWLEDGKLTMDQTKACEWIENKEQELKESLENITPSKIGFYSGLKKMITQNFKGVLSNKHYKFTGVGNRFYSVLTNMPKGLRACLLYDGTPLVGVDISNSQPYLMPIIFREAFWSKYYRGDQKPEKSLKIKDLRISKEEINIDTYTIIKSLKTFESLYGKDFKKIDFFKLVLNGELYEFLQGHFSKYYPEKFSTRRDTKNETLKILFSNHKAHFLTMYEPCRLFNEFFPEVYPVLNAIREHGYKTLPLLLQAIESHLMIDIICKKINDKYPLIPLYTIHDNILTTLGSEKLVKEVMEETLEQYVGFKPMLKYEYPDGVNSQIENEIWKPIPGYENEYHICLDGSVKSIERIVKHRTGFRKVQEHILTSRIDTQGYDTVRLSKDGKESTHFIHRLMANTYLSNIFNYPEVNHINGIKDDNRLKNLEWVSHSQNMRHAYKTGLIRIKKNCVEILDSCTGEVFQSIKEAAIYHSINYSTCKNYLNGNRPNPTCLCYLKTRKVA